jgi:anaerobic magnesium-protoporphyrin IX monomethyl ester cyclase
VRKKIVLYNPIAVFFDMPLALLAVGSALDALKYEVKIIDARIDDNAHETLLEECKDALCLGVTSLTGKPILDALEATQKVGKAVPELPIIWGGWHPSLFAKETLLDEPVIDITVQAQGEITFQEIVECLSTGKSVAAVKGICYRENGEIKQNPPRAMVNMNDLPPVNYDLIDVEAYFKKKGRRQFDYISSTGCYFRCAFCADPFVFQRKFSAIEPERMGKELKAHYDKYQFDDINFQDETFFTYQKRVVGIANQLIDQGIKTTWAGTMRADQGYRLTEDDFILLKKSGLRRVLIGVESGSQEMMDWLAKDIKIEQVYECAERCRKHGIDVIFPFIVGFPGETDKSVLDSLNMARELRLMSKGFTTPVFYFKPYPGSKITSDVVKEGYKLPQTIKEWGDFDYIGSSGPWVNDKKYKLVEQFKFYNKLGGTKGTWYTAPIQSLAKWRTKKHRYALSIEKPLIEWLKPEQELS